ncbi:MAG TPA: MFS transporter [Clostridiaceae bacterium]
MDAKALIKKVYFSKEKMKNHDFINSRKLYIYEGSFATGIMALTSGAFLAGFAKYMGASDQFNGIVAAIPAFAGIIQILSPVIFEKLEHRKLLICILSICFRMLLSAMVLIPIAFSQTGLRLGSLAIIYTLAYILGSFIGPPVGNWIIDLTPEHIRGNYCAVKDMYALLFMTVLTLFCGKLLDYFKYIDKEYNGFLIIGAIAFVMTIIHFFIISSIKEPMAHKSSFHIDLKKAITEPFANKQFRKIIIFSALWNIGFCMANPFFSVYMVANLKLDYTYIMIVGVVSTLVRVSTTKLWGRFADRNSWFLSTKLSIAMVAIAHSTWFFINPQTMWVLIPVAYIIGGFAWAGVNISIFNIQFQYAPKDGRTMYVGTSAAIGGLLGFTSSIIGSIILSIVGTKIIKLGIFAISNMQIIFAISGIALFICAIYIHYFIKQVVIDA